MGKYRHLRLVFIFFISFYSYSQTTLTYTSSLYHYNKGLELFAKEKYGAAQEAFEKYLASGDNSLHKADAEYYIAFSSLSLFHKDGEKLINDFIEKYPNHPKAYRAFYELGSFYFNNKNYDKTIAYLGKVDLRDLDKKQRLEAQYKLGYSHFTQKEFDKAGKYFNSIKRTENKYSYAASYYAGYIGYRQGDYDAAIEDFKRAEKSEAYQPFVPGMIINVYYKQGKYDEVIQYASTVNFDKIKNGDDILLMTGEAYYRKGNFPKAKEFFDRYFGKNKYNSDNAIMYRYAYAQMKTGNDKEAIEGFKKIAGKNDTLAQVAAYYMGTIYLKQGNKEYALTAFDQSRKLDFNKDIQEEAFFNYAKINYDLGKSRDALSSLKEFSSKFPKSEYIGEVNEMMSEVFLVTDNYAEAIRHIESLPTKSKRIEEAYQQLTYLRGIELFNNGLYPDAVEMFNKSLSKTYDLTIQAGAHFWSGEAYSIGKRYEDAIKSYNSVLTTPGLKKTEFYNKSQYGLGYAYFNLKDYNQALTYFKNFTDAVRFESDKKNYSDGLLRLADCYYAIKNYNEALTYYNRVLEQAKADKDYALYQKGIVLTALNRGDEAKNTFEQMTSSFPQSRYADEAIFQKANVDFEKGRYEAAVTGFTKVINLNSNHNSKPYAYLNRGIAYSNLQNYNAAVLDYQTILKNYPTHTVANGALLGLKEALAASGKGENFDEYVAMYKKANPDDKSLEGVEFDAAQTFYFNEKYELAIKNYKQYINNYPSSGNSIEAKFFIAESYNRLNDSTNALSYYQQVIEEQKSRQLSKAYQRAGEIELGKGNYENAISNFRNLITLAKNKKEQFSAWEGMMEAYYYEEEYDSARYFAGEIVNNGGANVNAQNKAMLLIGKTYYLEKNYDKALDELLNAVNSAADVNGAEAKYLMALIQYEQKRYKQSLETCFQLNSTFGSYEKWLNKSFLLIADNYIAMDETFQAEMTLKSIIDKSPNKEAREAAKRKLATLKPAETTTQE